ncbi:hypothetical protein GCK72_017018 [Caenorhabditis remanei]|uniref:Uncharacterized protein n=1 Tax=Caenorhabditis remanei TaxID=31234 RepID=A0A6A5G602_CAERE|nr:hypothetical protein GCK72_017018 [Caenorhabditis remanei]KAF1750468.1 hypothetical protein GCK72_017018 [Caenorhabditis remanei]
MEKQHESSSMAMRLYATWDVDRATPSTVPRIFNVSINRILLDCVSPEVNSIIVTAKLPLSKRSRYLRSNEIKVTPNHGRIDLDCDISFCIQYPHFLKRKSNVLQLLIQRRKKYKNRLPGGLRDLAVGNINLTYIMQQGGLREIQLNPSSENEVELKGVGACAGKLFLASCYSQAPEIVDDRDKQKKNVEDSEEETETDYDDVGDDLNEMPSGRSHQRHKTSSGAEIEGTRRTKGKNLKYQMNKLFNMFRPEDGRRPGVQVKEMPWEDDDLDSPYDSGPEMFNDDASIRSNRRPQLAPFFDQKEKIDHLAAMYEVSDGDGDSDQENTRGANRLIQKDSIGSAHPESTTPVRTAGMRVMTSSFDSHSQMIPHSSTLNSIKNDQTTPGPSTTAVHRGVSLSEQLSAILGTNMSPDGSDAVWLCNLSEWPAYATLAGPVPLVNCPSFSQVRQTLSHVINRIQNFCHSNSSNPPLSIVGIIGTDKLFSQVVKAYVECLAHKSLANLINHLRFVAIPSTSSLFYKLIEGIDPQLDNLCRDLWDRFGDMNHSEKTGLAAKIAAWPNSVSSSKLNLPIGEAMLQLTADRDPEGGRVFLPFLSEVRVGSLRQCEIIENDDDSNGFAQTIVSSPREESVISKIDGGSSPPHSPQLRNVDGQELNMDFWPNNQPTVPLQYSSYGPPEPSTSSSTVTTPNSKKDTAKVTIKAHFKTLLVSRSPSSGSLSLTYLKEKRKDKMLQKLGMKKGQKQKPEEGAVPSQVSSIGRMLCSATGKHNELTGEKLEN